MLRTLCVFLMLFFGANFACAYDFKYDFNRVTNDERIAAALKVLENTGSTESLKNIFQKNNGKYTRIIFYDLGMISSAYKNHYAMTCKDNFGEKNIIINAKYRNSSKEALAALIAHESIHSGENPNLEEEIQATVNEANQWNKSLAQNPKLRDDASPLIQRLNNLSELYGNGGEEGVNAISQKITKNEFYRDQFNAGKV